MSRLGSSTVAAVLAPPAATTRSATSPVPPAMEGARFKKVEARRPDLRWPFPENFAKRLEGKTVAGLGRRGKYLLLDLSSGEVLMMHLGMSGSFRVLAGAAEKTPSRYHH